MCICVCAATTDFEPGHNDRTTLIQCPTGLTCSTQLCVAGLQVSMWAWCMRLHQQPLHLPSLLRLRDQRLGLTRARVCQWTHRGGSFKAANGVEVGLTASARIGLLTRNINVRACARVWIRVGGSTHILDMLPCDCWCVLCRLWQSATRQRRTRCL